MGNTNYIFSKKRKFVNPYNFVPVDCKKTAREAMPDQYGELTGYIECDLIARTPLAIPDTAEKEEVPGIESGPHYFYPFMKRPDGKYMIPGSSIRGPVRSVFETLTDSCFSSMANDTPLTQRVSSSSAYNPGILKKENGVWHLYKAERYRYPIDDCKRDKVKSGDFVAFDSVPARDPRIAPVVTRVYTAPEKYGDKKQGYVVIGENIFRKKNESIFLKKQRVEIDDDLVQKALKGLDTVYEYYNDSAINKNLGQGRNGHHGYKAYPAMKKNGTILLWYRRIKNGKNDLLYFSLAAIGRKVFNKTLNELVLEKAPCTDRRNLCEACRLFGMVTKNGTGGTGVGSRVRFSDAVCTTPEKVGKKLTLIELGSPKTSYMPFYANVSQDDYGPGRQAGYDDVHREIRGRKYYWHSTIPRTTEVKNKRNSTVAVADAGSSFKFRVYFDGITEKQLKRLIYSLNFYENERNGKMCHKIGHGKPAGLGSVKISVEDVKVRNFTLRDGYHLEDYHVDYNEQIFRESDTLKALIRICDFQKAVEMESKNGVEIRYPFVLKATEEGQKIDPDGYKWFTANSGNAIKKYRKFDLLTLPDINEENVSLKAFQPDNKPHDNYGRNNNNGWNNNRGRNNYHGNSNHGNGRGNNRRNH